MRILVADDDPNIRGLLVLELTSADHVVDEAADGAQALAAIQGQDYDAVVLDVMMPSLSGWDVLSAVRTDDRHAKLPIILLSARDVADDVRHGYELGASVVLAKPYDGAKLVDLIAALGAPRPDVLDAAAAHQTTPSTH